MPDDKIPAVLGSALYDPKRKFVPGSSTDYSCKNCGRRLVVSPSSLRHMERMRDTHEFWLFCPWCTDQLAQIWARQTPDSEMHVMLAPGADAELRAAGLDLDADKTVDEVERIRRLFGGE